MTRSAAEDADGGGPGRPGPPPRQLVEAHDSSAVNVAGHDIYQLVNGTDRPRDRPGNVSVEPPFGRIDLPLRGRDELVSKIWPPAGDPANGRGAVHVLYGLGGCGKSRVALEIAQRARDAGQAVWWVSATGRTLIGASMREIAGCGGEVEFWGKPDTEQDYARQRRADYGLDREFLGDPHCVVAPELGDLLMFDAARIHGVRKVSQGSRVTAACFVGVRTRTDPLVVFA